ncbi:hypothetical protein SLE2022_001210 [Rubroshorea leprosula]
MASAKPLDLEITIISAKHLHNVNWRNGDLKPYVVFYLHSDHRLATRSDDSGSTRPVWNESFALPITRPIYDSVLTIDIFHFSLSDAPKPLVGSLKFPLTQLVDSADSNSVRTLELLRSSGRPQGKIRIKLVVKERQLQDYQSTPRDCYYYTTATVPVYREYSPYSDNSYHYASQPPPPPPPPPPSRLVYNRESYYYGAPSIPSAPVDMSPCEEHKPPLSSNHGGPSAPVDYSPCDQKEFEGLSMGRNNVEKEQLI